MARQDPEKLFRRFRARGDVAALTRLFDEVAPRLMGLACHLVWRPDLAEDVVQATFLTAIERAGSWDAARPLEPWLVGILTRHALASNRREARGVDAERLPEREVADPAAEVARLELSAELQGALGRLPPRYRDVLLPYLQEGAAPRDIAARLERAPGTVRVQIHRGLELLRKKLPASLALGAGAALLPTRGHASVRAAVEAAGEEYSSALPVAPAAWALPVSAKVLAAATVLLGGAGLSWIALRSPDAAAGGPRPEEALVRELRPVGVREGADSAAAARGARASARTDAASANEDAGWDRVGDHGAPGVELAVHLDGFAPTTDAPLEVSVLGAATGRPPLAARVAPAGGFTLDVSALFAGDAPAPKELLVELDHPEHRHARAVARVDTARAVAAAPGSGERVELPVTLRLRRAAFRVTGVVEPADGASGARVALFPLDRREGGPRRDPVDVATVAPGEPFTLRALAAGPHAVVALLPGRAPATVPIELGDAELVDLGLLATGAGASISGRVVLPGGLGPEGVEVAAHRSTGTAAAGVPRAVEGQVWAKVDPYTLLWQDGRFSLGSARASVGSDSRFALRGLQPGRYALMIAELPGVRFSYAKWSTTAEAPSSDVLVGEDAAVLRLVVQQEGARVPRAFVMVDMDGGATSVTEADERGECALLLRAEREYRYTVGAKDCRMVLDTVLVPPRGEERELVVELERDEQTWADLLLVPEGDAPAELLVEWKPADVGEDGAVRLLRGTEGGVLPDTQPFRRTVPLGPDGYLLDDVHPGRMLFRYGPASAGSHALPGELALDVPAGERTVRAIALAEGGRLRVQFLGHDGVGRARVTRCTDAKGREHPLFFWPRDYTALADEVPAGLSWFRRGAGLGPDLAELSEAVPDLPPGVYELTLEPEGFQPWSGTVRIEAGRATDLAVELR